MLQKPELYPTKRQQPSRSKIGRLCYSSIEERKSLEVSWTISSVNSFEEPF